MIALQGDSINETVKCANQIFGLENSFYPWQPAWNDFCANNDSTPYINGCSSWCNNYTIVAFYIMLINLFIGPIVFTSVEKIIELNDGDDITLNCSAKGYPKPTLEWNWDGRDVKFYYSFPLQFSKRFLSS